MLNFNDIMEFENVHGYIDPNGITFLMINDVARELGFEKEHVRKTRPINLAPTSGGQGFYSNMEIRWDRINEYLTQYNLPPVKSGDYIPENVAILLAVRANNSKAKEFHLKLANVIIPYFRKIVYPEDYEKMKNDSNYLHEMLSPDNLISSTEIAKDYGISAQTLHLLLHRLGVIYEVNNNWVLYSQLSNFGYTKTKTVLIQDKPVTITYWTGFGQRFIHDLLAWNGIFPFQNNMGVIEYLLHMIAPVYIDPNFKK